MCGADPDTEIASDTAIPIIDDLAAEVWGCDNRGVDGCLACTNLLQELCY